MNFEETATLKIGGQTGQILLQAVRDFPHLRKTKNILSPSQGSIRLARRGQGFIKEYNDIKKDVVLLWSVIIIRDSPDPSSLSMLGKLITRENKEFTIF